MSTKTITSTREQPVQQPAASDEGPRLSLRVLTRPAERIDALKLIADSIAQQRQSASQVLIFHPICLAILAGFIAITHVVAGIARNDYSAMVITYAGVVLTYLLAIRYCTSAYIQTAENMDWHTWLKGPDGKDDIILGAQYGADIIAALVLRLPKSRSGDKALIRAWTTKTRYRRRGLGGDMLREAVKVAKERRGRNCDVEFAKDHANSSMPLHSAFTATFEARDDRLAKALSNAVAEVSSD